jgi:hypothetical protein
MRGEPITSNIAPITLTAKTLGNCFGDHSVHARHCFNCVMLVRATMRACLGQSMGLSEAALDGLKQAKDDCNQLLVRHSRHQKRSKTDYLPNKSQGCATKAARSDFAPCPNSVSLASHPANRYLGGPHKTPPLKLADTSRRAEGKTNHGKT